MSSIKINELVKSIHLNHWNGVLPVAPRKIARKMGVEVNADPFMKGSGLFKESGGPTITYNSSESDQRQRFTLAHELGHFALQHGDSPRDTTKQFSSTVYDQKEVQANRFAAELLMPGHMIDEYIGKRNIFNISEMAIKFGVSEAAMKYRLKNLGWL